MRKPNPNPNPNPSSLLSTSDPPPTGHEEAHHRGRGGGGGRRQLCCGCPLDPSERAAVEPSGVHRSGAQQAVCDAGGEAVGCGGFYDG